VTGVLQVIDRRHAPQLLVALVDGPQRYNKLLRFTGHDTTLTAVLRHLEDHGLVERSVRIDRPVGVYYTLTARGRVVAEVLVELQVVDGHMVAGERVPA
jgi:DNA-binding HxlR family transcriptional regulator